MTERVKLSPVYWLAWMPFAVVYALILHQRTALADSILSAITAVGVAALLGLVVHRISGVIQSRERERWRFLLAHVVVGAGYAAIWTAVIALMIRFGAPAPTWRAFVDNAIWWQFVTGLALYGLIAGIFTAQATNRRLREQEAIAARAEALRVRAELRALRAQLNPHFLFNTLHSITALVRSDPRAAEGALERFGLLMHRVLEMQREQRDEVSLGDDLDFVRSYLALEQLRFGDRLRVVEEIDPDALECYILTFSLQPLVENAVRYGIAPLAAGGTIRIAASIDDDLLHLEVADDGAGADAARIAAHEGVGLHVVRQRLAARFGDAARLDVTTAPNEGFRAHLVLPVVLRPLALRVTAEHPVPR